jgi:hypothetical protein
MEHEARLPVVAVGKASIFLFRAIGRMLHSMALESISMRSSSRKRTSQPIPMVEPYQMTWAIDGPVRTVPGFLEPGLQRYDDGAYLLLSCYPALVGNFAASNW